MIFKKSCLWIPKGYAQRNSSVSWPFFCGPLIYTFSHLVPTVDPWALAGELANVTEPGKDTVVLRDPSHIRQPFYPCIFWHIKLPSSDCATRADCATASRHLRSLPWVLSISTPSCLEKIQHVGHFYGDVVVFPPGSLWEKQGSVLKIVSPFRLLNLQNQELVSVLLSQQRQGFRSIRKERLWCETLNCHDCT